MLVFSLAEQFVQWEIVVFSSGCLFVTSQMKYCKTTIQTGNQPFEGKTENSANIPCTLQLK